MKLKGWKCRSHVEVKILHFLLKIITHNSCGRWLKWFLQKPTKFFKDMSIETCSKKEVLVKALNVLRLKRMIKK